MENKKVFDIKITVLIPCKDRASYLYQTLRTCALQDYDNLEIIVSDDGSSDDTKEVVENFSIIDSRIKYITPDEGRSVGMSANFEYALDQVKEGYVIVLGGDDAILPGGISSISKILNDSNTSILTWSNASYFYPNENNANGQIVLKGNHGFLINGLRKINSNSYLKRQAKNLNYVHDIEAPMIYVKSAVSIDLINKVKSRSKDGRFYSCSVPDGYSGIVLAGEVNEYLFSSEPYCMHGVSKFSAGLNYMTESEKARKISKSFIDLASSQPMHKELASIPYTPLISTMTADFLLTANDLPGWQGNFGRINFKSLIDKAFEALAHGQLPYSSLNRELYLLREIARYHKLDDYFYKKLKKTKRNSKGAVFGSALSPEQIYIDGKDFDLNNVVDAGYLIKNMYALSKRKKFKNFYNIIKNSLAHKLTGFIKEKKFPDESEWGL